MESKIEKYFSKHPIYNSVIHLLGGIGIGILLTHPFFDPHPVRYGVLFVALSLLGHVYAYMQYKKRR